MASAKYSFSPAAARAEARALFGFVERGVEPIEKLRRLIAVTPTDERRIRAAADGDPVLFRPLDFRGAVLKQFGRMVRRHVPKAKAARAGDALVACPYGNEGPVISREMESILDTDAVSG